MFLKQKEMNIRNKPHTLTPNCFALIQDRFCCQITSGKARFCSQKSYHREKINLTVFRVWDFAVSGEGLWTYTDPYC